MTQLLSYWSMDVVSLVLLAGLAMLYGLLSGWRWRPGAGLYATALVLIGLMQASPLHFLGAHYLLSAHMVAHIVLLLVCAPLLVMGLPQPTEHKAAYWLTSVSTVFQKRPWLGWALGLGVMWFWHIPAVYETTLAHEPNTAGIPICTLAGTSSDPLTNLLHLLHPISLLLAGICFAWPVLGPLPTHRIQPLAGVLYLFTACVGCSLLGLLITFAPVGLYSTYTGFDYSGIDQLVRQEWGFDRVTDQQTAGLLMWVPGCLIYLTGALYLIRQWLVSEEKAVPTSEPHLILK